MVRRVRPRRLLAAMSGAALAACSARYLVSGTVVDPNGDPLPDVLVAPRIKCAGDPPASAHSDVTDADGGYRSGFSYASDHTVVEFTKAEYQKKCVDLAPLWRRDCGSADGGAADRCANIDVELAPANVNRPGVDAPSRTPPADRPTSQPPDGPATTPTIPMTD
jgi:hypothetical protein